VYRFITEKPVFLSFPETVDEPFLSFSILSDRGVTGTIRYEIKSGSKEKV